MIFQDFQLLSDRTIEDNLRFVLQATEWKNKADIDARIDEVLNKVGLPTKKHKLPHQLSGGEQQRVAIARAIVGNPKIIIADEPTGNLDTELSIEIFKIFERINANGITIVIATHDTHLMNLFPKRTIKLEKGRLVADGISR